MEPIFNEHSLEPQAKNIYEATERMRALQKLLSACKQAGLSYVLRTHENIWNEGLCPGVTLSAWLYSQQVEKELRQAIRSLLQKSSHVESVLNGMLKDDSKEAHWEGKLCKSFTLAYLQDVPLVSLSSPNWMVDKISVNIIGAEEICNDSPGEKYELVHFYNEKCLASKKDWIRQRLRPCFVNGAQIVKDAKTALPFLEFSKNAQKQLNDLSGSEQVFRFVVSHLIALNECCDVWINSGCGVAFVGSDYLKCSPESQSTMDQYSDDRTFMFADGESRVCEWHSKIRVDEWRVHFFACPKHKKVFVGSVGAHLRISSD